MGSRVPRGISGPASSEKPQKLGLKVVVVRLYYLRSVHASFCTSPKRLEPAEALQAQSCCSSSQT